MKIHFKTGSDETAMPVKWNDGRIQQWCYLGLKFWNSDWRFILLHLFADWIHDLV